MVANAVENAFGVVSLQQFYDSSTFLPAASQWEYLGLSLLIITSHL